MNADLKRVRGDDMPSSSSSPAKKRALSVSNVAQGSCDTEGGVEEWQSVVEVRVSSKTRMFSQTTIYTLSS